MFFGLGSYFNRFPPFVYKKASIDNIKTKKINIGFYLFPFRRRLLVAYTVPSWFILNFHLYCIYIYIQNWRWRALFKLKTIFHSNRIPLWWWYFTIFTKNTHTHSRQRERECKNPSSRQEATEAIKESLVLHPYAFFSFFFPKGGAPPEGEAEGASPSVRRFERRELGARGTQQKKK